jgi:hypothetical protein
VLGLGDAADSCVTHAIKGGIIANKGDIINVPPHSYCTSYSSLSESLTVNDDYPLTDLFHAATSTVAVCPTTGFTITTPFHAKAWAMRLAATRYPHPAAAVTLVKCLRDGVDLGFRGDRTRTQVGANLESAVQHPLALRDNITKETNNGRRKGPYATPPPFPFFYSNPLGVVFKKGKSKPRVIHHLSWPRTSSNSSVNASILAFNVKLDAFDKAVQAVRELGKGCFMSKVDIESAYRCIPVRPAPNKESDLCMRAAMWLCTCGLLRAGEFVTKPTNRHTLKLQHLIIHDANHGELNPLQLNGQRPAYMSVRLEQSKTDPFRQGTTIIIGNERAIAHMLAYLQRRNKSLGRLPLFADDDGQALAAAALVRFMQALIERANIPNAHLFLGHSFRKGGATSLHEAGHPDSLIKVMGRWASFAFATYIDTPIHMLIKAGRSLRKVESTMHAVPTESDSSWDVSNLQ